jgi:hypothetical protein
VSRVYFVQLTCDYCGAREAYPEDNDGQASWQRVVSSEMPGEHTSIPKEYAVLLLPVLSRYFATHATSEISGETLRQALPDLFSSVRFLAGKGIAIVAEFLTHLAAAAHELSTSA